MMEGVEMDVDTFQFVEENRALKAELERVTEQFERLQHDSKFNIQTASQLRDIIQARTSDEIQEKLMQKSLQNAELNMQVDQLNHELKQSRGLIEDLAKERENNKRMLLELAGIVKTLNTVDLDYTPSAASLVGAAEGSAQDQSLNNIKRKVEAIMEDRERVLDFCEELEEDNAKQAEKIRALEDQFQMLNTLHMAQKESKNDPPSKESSSHNKRNGMDPAADEQTVTSETEASTYVSSVGQQTFDSHDKEELEQTKEELETTKEELTDARARYKRLREECHKVLGRVTEMENSLDKSRKDLRLVKQKRDEYKLNLKTLIEQYKELHGENTEAIRNVLSLHLQTRKMQVENERLEQERREVLDMLVEEADRRKREIEQWKAAYFDETHADYEELKNAYNMALSKLRLIERQLADTQLELKSAEQKMATREKHLRDTVSNYRKLEREQSTVLERVADSERSLAVAKQHVHRYKEEAKHTRRRLALVMKQLRQANSQPAREVQTETVATVSIAPTKEPATPDVEKPVEEQPIEQPAVENEEQETREEEDDQSFTNFMKELEGQDTKKSATVNTGSSQSVCV